MTTITATYSPEDNKLRLYPSSRLDAETYNRVKEAGFKWAPKQELFVAPTWTPGREDLCMELAGDIEPEGTTMAERAEAKAARLDALAEKRRKESNAFYNAARRIGERFAYGQPILIGHHSERRARKDQERMNSAMQHSVKASEAVDYWLYRAAGVEAHANRKGSDQTRENRIKKLLAELRDMQRSINHAWKCLELWQELATKEDAPDFAEQVEHWAGARRKDGSVARTGHYFALRNKEKTPVQVVQECIAYHEAQTRNPTRYRWIEHTLNRLAYERAEQGGVERFTGDLTAATLQIFAREQGAESPKATKNQASWTLTSSVPLPLHLAEGNEITLTDDDWRSLMQAAGHLPTTREKRSGTASIPLLNLDVYSMAGRRYGTVNNYVVVKMTKAEYAAINTDYKGTMFAICGQFRFRTVYRDGRLSAVFLTDSKSHPAPESVAIRLEPEEHA